MFSSFLLIAILGFSCFVTSFISALTGLAGGALLISILATLYSPITALALHSLIQAQSNFVRILIYRKYVFWPLVAKFVLLLIPGCYLGQQFLTSVNANILQGLLGLSLVLASFPKIKFNIDKDSKIVFYFLGFLSGFLGMIIGATGPLLAPFFMAAKLEKESFVATKAACQFVTQLVKTIFFFGLINFAYIEYVTEVVIAFSTILLGALLGKKAIQRVSAKQLNAIIRVILALMGLRLILKALNLL